MTEQELKVIRGLREQGYAVVLFTPEELEDTPSDDVESMMIAAGWDAIEVLKGVK